MITQSGMGGTGDRLTRITIILAGVAALVSTLISFLYVRCELR